MNNFQPGDIVDVTITGVRVGEEFTQGGRIAIHFGGEYMWLDPTSSDVTVTRRAPQPQADLLAAVSELHGAVKEWQDAEAAKTARTVTSLAELIKAKTATAG